MGNRVVGEVGGREGRVRGGGCRGRWVVWEVGGGRGGCRGRWVVWWVAGRPEDIIPGII